MTLKKITLPEWAAFLYESRHKEGDIVSVHHHEIHQILYAIEGQGEIFLDGKKYSVSQDQAALVVPYTKHSIVSHSSLTLLVLAFDMQSLGAFGQHELNNRFFSNSKLIYPDVVASSELRLSLRKMLYEQASENKFSGWACKINLLQILLTLARSGEKSQILDTNSIRAEKIKQYIDTFYYEPLSANDIAARLGISTRYVNSIFKEHYHKTPIQYLTDVRIETAKKLLIESDKDIVTICFEVGYETLSTFYRAFKNTLNMSPNQFRNTNQ
nr:AraC family transcriptional regulator [Paenibacillus bovis]